jgi:glycosyltransferase involved in cell wall biosynthesis
MLDPYSLSVRSWRKAIYLFAVENKNISAARRLIYTTSEEARLAETQVGSLPKGVVIPLGGDAPSESREKLAAVFFEKFPKARGRRQLLFLGRLHFKKGLDRVLMALSSVVSVFPSVLLTIAGDGLPDYVETIKNLVAAKGLENNVLLTGRLDGALKWGAYASAELFLLPSRQENFAITVAEAMQMGLPVIISNRVNTWSYVEAARAGVVLDEKGIEGSLGEAILSLLQNIKTIKLMGASGEVYARKGLTWPRSAESLLECYENVLIRSGRNGRSR